MPVTYFLGGHQSLPPGRRSRNAIVTLCVGDTYLRLWNRACRKSWERYARQHDFDLIVIVEALDARSRSPSWQKLLILEESWAQDYERIVWIDADIVIAPGAPDIVGSVPDLGKVGAALHGGQMSPAQKHVYVERIYKMRVVPEKAASAWRMHETIGFRQNNMSFDGDVMINGGVLVVTPARHRGFFANVYAQDGESRLYEQPYLSHELAVEGLLSPVSSRFNWSVHEAMVLEYEGIPSVGPADPSIVQFVRNELDKAYFLHFCGSLPVLSLLATVDPFPLDALYRDAA